MKLAQLRKLGVDVTNNLVAKILTHDCQRTCTVKQVSAVLRAGDCGENRNGTGKNEQMRHNYCTILHIGRPSCGVVKSFRRRGEAVSRRLSKMDNTSIARVMAAWLAAALHHLI